jgi:hypothetical protein
MLRELNKARAGFRIRADQAATAFLGAGDGRLSAVATGNWCAAGHKHLNYPFVRVPRASRRHLKSGPRAYSITKQWPGCT